MGNMVLEGQHVPAASDNLFVFFRNGKWVPKAIPNVGDLGCPGCLQGALKELWELVAENVPAFGLITADGALLYSDEEAEMIWRKWGQRPPKSDEDACALFERRRRCHGTYLQEFVALQWWHPAWRQSSN